ncbi:MAG: penicillin acylase family protein [Candidatus Aminicenantes bacterium]|nr:penicillin acylase family protein [Candidatus Aminicenantes bacterium]
MKRWWKALSALLLLGAAFWALETRHGMVPPLGKFLDPFTGFWRNNAAGDALPRTLRIPGLRDGVTVAWDDRHVPHIFAGNELDLYRAQGYLTARDRLWQMEFLSRYTGGRLAEILGPGAVAMDRLQRRLGMTWGAENFLQGIRDDARLRRILAAYCGGVNAYVDSLQPSGYPLEYKILDYAPGRWTPFDVALILKYMSWYLSGEGRDLELTQTRQSLGEVETDRLFPLQAPFQDPVIPPGTSWDFPPAETPISRGRGAPGAAPRTGSGTRGRPFAARIGSNNWAVSGSKTKSGFPILCGDPHLQLTLPAIWYEAQLAAPGMNVAGVSLPGTPGVVIGFNDRSAWSMTNAGSDVLDFYMMKFKDGARREYAWGEGWRPTSRRREKIEVRGGEPVAESVLYTHLGPVPFVERRPDMPEWIPAGAAMRWTGHDPSGILRALVLLNRARGLDDFHAAMGSFDCPPQNVAFASRDGHVAIRHNGRFPLRSRGQGRFLLDGCDPAAEWRGWVPMDQVPAAEDPERGFVSSANQAPVDASYPYYLGWDYAGFERGRRINELLGAAAAITPEDMARLQVDALNLRARTVLPRLLELLPREALSPEERKRAEELGGWDFVYRAGSTEPTVFHRFFVELYDATWEDELEMKRLFSWPGADRTVDLILKEPGASYFDDVTTPTRESLADIVRRAFSRSLEHLRSRFGPFGPRWRWGTAHPVSIRHLARIPGLGSPPQAVSGGSELINAASGSFGPSWRMVVELGPVIRAWGVLPGGASGNPGSRFYDDGIRDWREGRVRELVFLETAGQSHPRLVGRTVIGGGR